MTIVDAVIPWTSRFVRHVLGGLVDLALPHHCAGCGERVTGEGFCARCWSTLPFLFGPACARCDRPLPMMDGAGSLCGACMQSPPAYARVHAPLAYDALTRSLVLRLKYGRRPATAQLMARLMAPRVPFGDPNALLVPVPLHRGRLWTRGFNQSAELARHLARRSGLQLLPDSLRRTRATPTLRGLGRRARARAVRGAFTVDPVRALHIKGQTVLLVDDVFTSGATAEACARALLRGGASRVEVLAFARVVEDDSIIDSGHVATDITVYGA